MHRAWALSLVVLVGCYEDELVQCGDAICPAGQFCVDEIEVCVSPAQRAACDDKVDLELCSYDDVDGVCHSSICTVIRCGDSVVDPGERCDDGNTISGDGCSLDCTGRFAQMQTPVAWGLNRLHVVSPQEAYALGAQNTLLVYDGISWQQLAAPDGVLLRAVWATPGSIWLGGYNTTSDGGVIVNMTNGASTRFSVTFKVEDLWGRSDADIFAVGTSSSPGVSGAAHYDAKAWSPLSLTPCLANEIAFRVTGTATDTFISGGGSGICHGTSLESWSELEPYGTTATAVQADTLYSLRVAVADTLIRRYSLPSAVMTGEELFVPGDVESFTVLENGVIMAVGMGGTLLEYAPSSQIWSRIATPTSAQLHEIMGTSTSDLFIVGDAGTVLH